jgi:hypothetical protein
VKNEGRPWERNEPRGPQPHVMSEAAFEQEVARHKKTMAAYRKQVAWYVVSLGYQPRCWPETLETAKDLIAGRGR